jgi:hypothetical protein
LVFLEEEALLDLAFTALGLNCLKLDMVIGVYEVINRYKWLTYKPDINVIQFFTRTRKTVTKLYKFAYVEN